MGYWRSHQRHANTGDGKGGFGMLDAFGLGVLAQSSLLLAGLLAYWVTVPTRLVGILAGFGAGAMISAIPRQPSTLPNGRRSCGC
jgi:hypothetical protein